MQTRPIVERGTSEDLMQAAATGARIAARNLLAKGLNETLVRRQIIDRFLDEFGDDPPGELSVETLMAAVQRSVDQTLGYPTLEPLAI